MRHDKIPMANKSIDRLTGPKKIKSKTREGKRNTRTKEVFESPSGNYRITEKGKYNSQGSKFKVKAKRTKQGRRSGVKKPTIDPIY